MKTLEEIKAMRDELADKYEAEHHKNFPDGMDLSPYSNSEIPATCYSAGFDAAIGLMEEREKDCKHPGCCCVCGHQGRCPECGPTAGITEAICD